MGFVENVRGEAKYRGRNAGDARNMRRALGPSSTKFNREGPYFRNRRLQAAVVAVVASAVHFVARMFEFLSIG
jgi:hypothetical protein